jgi:hypothetical protein
MSLTDYLQMKKRLKILILGSYKALPPNPVDKAVQRLEELRKCLINKGFEQTMLARDFTDAEMYSSDLDEHYTLKSRKLIEEWADVPIFVFFKEADNQGVGAEITYACIKLSNKQSCCAAFFEGRLEDFSTQIKGSIKITRKVSYMIFRHDSELCNLAFGHCVKMLDRLFYYLR